MQVTILTEREFERYVEEMINDTTPEVQIGSLTYAPATVLRKVDPNAWNTAMSETEDTLREDGIMREENVEEDEDYWKCPECDEAYDDESEAQECCA